MTTDQFTFTVTKTAGAARTGEIRMPRGVIRTPTTSCSAPAPSGWRGSAACTPS